MEGSLPEGWETWPLDQKERFIEELRYNWEFWARPSQLPPPGLWNVWFVLGGRGVGKVLAVDFPIWKADALPSGEINQFHRSTMGAVRVGDYVLGPDGKPTLVIGAYDPEMHDEWVVTFSDGSTVLTDLNHRWCTWTHRDRKQYSRKRKGGANIQDYPEEWWSHTAPVRGSNEPYGPQIRTTKEILDTLKVGSRGDLNHSIPVTKPLQLPEAKLPIDPYCLGAWLGDGHANGASMSSHEDDMPFMRAQFDGAGYTTTSRKDAQMFGVVGGFHRDLRGSNLLGNKHIPEEYLTASYDQRLALLQGLMDTDGSIYSNGRTVEFCSILPGLAHGVHSLLASFGMKPTIKVGESWAYHKDGSRTRHGDRYRVSCRPTLNVFRMPRKVERLRLADTQNKRNAARMIVSIEPTGKRSMMRCIKVAHESSLFLVGESLIPTANTRTGAEFVKSKLLGYPGCRIGVIGQTIGAARDVCLEGEALAIDTPILTQDGWSTMGDLKVGDRVLAGDGSFTKIRWVSDVYHDRPTYEIEFAGGDTLVADENHKWLVSTYQSKVERVKTTSELLDRPILRGRVHQWRVAAPVATSGECRNQTIDPYVLGYWLGDGTSRGAAITTSDQFVLEEFERLGYPTTPHGKAPYAFGVKNLTAGLRSEGQINSKHIPSDAYTWPLEDRMSLIQGLMDSDGDISTRGQAAFNNTNHQLISDLRKLLISVGIRVGNPRVQSEPYEFVATNGKTYVSSRSYRISFTPTVQVFRLPRKAERVRVSRTRTDRRSIVGIKPIGSVPVRCISVEHASQTFLAGEAFIVTHNSGIIAVTNPKLVKKYNRSLGQLHLHNGSIVQTFSGGDPEKLRGFQSHFMWMDEICAYQKAQETYDMALMGLRLGDHPQLVLTSTPKPSPLIIELVNRSRTEPDLVRIVTESTFANAANLAESTLDELRRRYEGTTLGRQELYAELILEEPGALWKRPTIESNRREAGSVKKEDMVEIVVGVDPNMSQTTERKTECGIIVGGRGIDGHGYILEDGSLERPSPDAWARRVVDLYHRWGANSVVAEVNQGYDLVVHTIHTIDPLVNVKKVYSQRGKMLRAEPIAALAEQNRIHHVGMYPELEDQMVQWVPGNPSPDRLDAAVHMFTKIMLGGGVAEFYTPSNGPRLPPTIR